MCLLCWPGSSSLSTIVPPGTELKFFFFFFFKKQPKIHLPPPVFQERNKTPLKEHKMPRAPGRECLNLFCPCLTRKSDHPDTYESQAHQVPPTSRGMETSDALELRAVHGPVPITTAEPPASLEMKTAQVAETRVDRETRAIENTGIRTGSKLEAAQPSTRREVEITKDMQRPSAQRPKTAKNTESPALQEIESSEGAKPPIRPGTETTTYTKLSPGHKEVLSEDLGPPGPVAVEPSE